MKLSLRSIILFCIACSWASATPDWNKVTNEEYLGSNEEVYAVMQTITDNQGNYYSSREIKTFFEYSKIDNSIINQELVSDIIYNIDPEHIDPNTPPKVTKVVRSLNKKLLLSILTTNYNKPVITPPIPSWTQRLSWKNEGIYLDEKLLIIPKDEITKKQLPFDAMREQGIIDSIARVHQDNQCLYVSLKFGDSQNYENAIIRISPELSKQINDWSTKLGEYLFISEHKTREEANKASLDLIEIAKNKDYYAMNLEIWSIQKTPTETAFIVVHRPFDVPMDATKINLLNSIIERQTKTIKSTDFIQKWIPFTTPENEPKSGEEEQDQPIDKPIMPDDPDEPVEPEEEIAPSE